ncbi:hypothetical protein AN449_02510 [Pseudomonas aeruginosa]|uniref:hypothetical protein n=1 Tax=Pseudomonas aeruginosa TaxID=287 RepID=UPI00071767DE|nr:hypothetical protein [Pseudomonas aeruginosa]KRU69626.1 hypothetical protein AN449_02510 [Pseudomonas aeruginosa]VEE75770.1 Uncharacterised protein [Pseudomonas aeruginosa]
MKFKDGQFVDVKLIGFAKVDAVEGDNYRLFFADGKRGGGWKDHDIAGLTTEKKFWSEWRRHRQCSA